MDTTKEFLRERVISSVICESGVEYSLPDYNTDVKKILLTSARAVPSGCYQNGDTVELVGIVCYEMVYIDGENRMTHLDFNSDYSIGLKINGEDYRDADATSAVSSYSIRLSGPRKIIAKATVGCEARIVESARVELLGDAFTVGEPQVVSRRAKIRTADYLRGNEREYAESVFHLDGAIIDETDLLYTSIEPENMTAQQTADGIGIKGTMLVTALIKGTDTEPVLMRKRLPYSETLECGSAVCNDKTEVRIVVSSEKITLTADEDGVEAVASFIVEPSIRICDNTVVELTEDCYLKDRGCDNEYRDMQYTELLGSCQGEDKFSQGISREAAGCGGVRNLICPVVQARNEKVTSENGVTKIECELRFLAIGCEVTEEGEPIYSSVKLDMPYSKECALDFCPDTDGVRFECNVEAGEPNITVDGDNVYPECSIRFYLSAVRDRSHRILASASATEERFLGDPSKVTVYFPEKGDTLFSVCKRFHSSLLAVASDNSLSDECIATPSGAGSLLGIKKLIIK